MSTPTNVIAHDVARAGRQVDAILRYREEPILADWRTCRRLLRDALRACELAIGRLEVAST